MTDVEDRNGLPAGTTSFQRMLELEKKYKLERLQNTKRPLSNSPSSPVPPVSLRNRVPLQDRRADSLQRQQHKEEMLKAVRRSIALPPLSITIPPGGGDRPRGASRDTKAGKKTESEGPDKTSTSEPVHKQVKFLALADGEDETEEGEGQGGSDGSSSICQSPSWEGYGQKQKDKKQEAERKRKEKDQAAKEAKEARKKLAARLSKAPPNLRRSSTALALANSERSMSDTILTTHRGLQPPARGLAEMERDLAKAHSHLNVALASQTPPSSTEPESKRLPTRGRQSGQNGLVPGLVPGLVQERPATSASHYSDSEANDSTDPRQRSRKSQSVGPDPSAPAPTVKDHKPPRDSCPPSASRTPMLRKDPAPARGRSPSFLHGAAKIFRGRDRKNQTDTPEFSGSNASQESVHSVQVLIGNDRGRQPDGYVRHQRTQSNERAMANIADEQLNTNVMVSRHERRPSLTREAKSVARRLVGLKSDGAKTEKDHSKSHEKDHDKSQSSADYMKLLKEPYSPPGLELLSPEGSLPASMRKGNTHGGQQSDPANGTRESLSAARKPMKEKISTDSAEPSPRISKPLVKESPTACLAPSNLTGRGKESAKQATSKGSKDSSSSVAGNPVKSSASAAPYSRFRARLNSFTSKSLQPREKVDAEQPANSVGAKNPYASKAVISVGPANASENQPTTKTTFPRPLTANPIKTTTVKTKTGSHSSEGSLSSSAYDDGSPLPSPATTPNTSRPQSSGGLPAVVVEKSETKLSLDKGDQRTLHNGSEGRSGSYSSSAPRVEIKKFHEGRETTEEEQWSRTAIPLEIDFDAQSFVTSLTNLDHLDGSDELVSVESLITPPLPSPHAITTRESREWLGQKATETRELATTPKQRLDLSETSNTDLRRNWSAELSVEGSFDRMSNRDVVIPPKSAKRASTPIRTPTSPLDDNKPKETAIKREKNHDAPVLKDSAHLSKLHLEPLSKASGLKQEQEGNQGGSEQMSKTQRLELKSSGDWNHQGEAPRKRHHRKETVPALEAAVISGRDTVKSFAPENGIGSDRVEVPLASLEQTDTSSSTASTSSSSLLPSRLLPPIGSLVPPKGFAINPYLVDFEDGESRAESSGFGSFRNRTTPVVPPSPSATVTITPGFSSKARTASTPSSHVAPGVSEYKTAPTAAPTAVPTAAPASTPVSSSSMATRKNANGRNAPVSILKQKTREPSPPAAVQGLTTNSSTSLASDGSHVSSRSQPMLSALPKHMQLQTGVSVRPPAAVTEHRAPPMAKMLVECCSCKFFHDMPSKVYECMARPDAVVEDRKRGVSGAITTRVKCPWCQHDMSTRCCAGYAAVVYLKEKLH